MKKRMTKEIVFEIALRLERSGVEVSSNRIRDEFGSGSLTTISKYLKEWKELRLAQKEESYPDMKEVLGKVEEDVLIDFFSNELSQMTALIFSYLEPKKAAAVLKGLPKEKRNDILSKMENMEFVQSRIVGQLAKVLESEFHALAMTKSEQVGGKALVHSIRQEMVG